MSRAEPSCSRTRTAARPVSVRGAVALLLVLSAWLTGCGEDGGSLSLSIEFDDTVANPEASKFIELTLVDSCDGLDPGDAVDPGEVKKTWKLEKGEPLPSFGTISSGSHGLYGRAFLSDCSVMAAGCVAFSAGKGEKPVTLVLSDADCTGNEARCGTRVCDEGDAGPPENAPPSAPGTLTATGVIGGAVLTWGEATDDVLVEAYRVYRGDEAGFTPSEDNRVGRVTDLEFMDLVAAGTHFYVVVAEDNKELLGPPSNEASADALADEEAPSAPGTVVATTGVGTITLTWGAATDNVGVTKYTVHRGTSANVVPSEENRVADVTGLTHVDITAPGTYYFRVVAEDHAGNRGPASNEVSGLSAQAPPSAPGTLTATGGIGKVNLSWGAADDDVGIAAYHVHRSTSAGFTPDVGNRVAMPTGLTYSDTVSPGTYYYVVIPVDLGGLSGPQSNEASGVSTADTTDPSAPGAVTATGGVRQIALSWGAATDNVAVVGYNIYRSMTQGFVPGAGNLLTQTSGTSYTNTSILGTYYYRVAARDAAGNIGAFTTEVGAIASQALSYSWAADYSGACPFNIYGNAACGTEVRLTDAVGFQRGAAYNKDSITIGSDTSFAVSFRIQFDMPSAVSMADGIVFVVRKTTAPPLGHMAGSIGYGASPVGAAENFAAVAPSVAVEFDTYSEGADPGGAHIAVLKDGVHTVHLGATSYAIPTAYLYGWVDYDGINNILRVYVSLNTTKPASALITQSIDIPAALGGASTATYFGFTAGTGGYLARQRVGPFSIKTYD